MRFTVAVFAVVAPFVCTTSDTTPVPGTHKHTPTLSYANAEHGGEITRFLRDGETTAAAVDNAAEERTLVLPDVLPR